jgi:hypothetical protein
MHRMKLSQFFGGTALLIFGALAGDVHAATATFYGLDQAVGANAPRPNSDAAYTAFLNALGPATIGVEGFESDPAGSFFGGSIALAFVPNGIAGQLQSLATTTASVRDTNDPGTFAISGARWLDVATAGDTSFFELSFDAPVVAVGFYGSSFSNYREVGAGPYPAIRITIDGGEPVDVVDVPPQAIENASVNFFGVISDTPFTRVRMFNPAGTVSDGVGIDDFVVARPVPEPSSWVLTGVGLAIIGRLCTRRGRRARAA